jgi:hypothetical protein
MMPSEEDITKGGMPHIWLDDYSIEFPINKNGLIQHMKRLQDEFYEKYKKVPLIIEQTSFIVENLPNSNRLYGDRFDLHLALCAVVKNKKIVEKLWGVPIEIYGVLNEDFGSEEAVHMHENAQAARAAGMKWIMDNDDEDRRDYEKGKQELKRKYVKTKLSNSNHAKN